MSLSRLTTASQPSSDLAQQQVADRMAQRIVDVLEVVEVHQQHRQRAMFARGNRER